MFYSFIMEVIAMAKDPGIGYRVMGTITGVKGQCNAGHHVGEKFEVSCHNPGGLCGFFYHDIFPNLNVMQFGGKYPWFPADEMTLECPDRQNAVTLRVRRS